MTKTQHFYFWWYIRFKEQHKSECRVKMRPMIKIKWPIVGKKTAMFCLPYKGAGHDRYKDMDFENGRWTFPDFFFGFNSWTAGFSAFSSSGLFFPQHLHFLTIVSLILAKSPGPKRMFILECLLLTRIDSNNIIMTTLIAYYDADVRVSRLIRLRIR